MLKTFRFPEKTELRELWIKATKRNNWVPKKSSKMCSQHFYNTSLVKVGNKTYLHPETIPVEVRSVIIYILKLLIIYI